MSRCLMSACLALLLGSASSAGQFNKVLSVGDEAPAWSQLPGTDGKNHSLSDLKDQDVVVVVFTCNSCPVAVDYEDRLIAFAKTYASRKVGVVAINVNTIAEDRLDKMKERANEKKFPFLYLFDESQKIGKRYGAGYTPEVFVLDKERRVAYMGAIDDRSPPGEPAATYLKAAVDAILKGEKPVRSETLARGCRIRYGKSK